jgi:hypothetical protein
MTSGRSGETGDGRRFEVTDLTFVSLLQLVAFQRVVRRKRQTEPTIDAVIQASVFLYISRFESVHPRMQPDTAHNVGGVWLRLKQATERPPAT